MRCAPALSMGVHSLSICPSWLGWAAKSEWMFASANPVCVIWGPRKATEGQSGEGLYQVKSSIDKLFCQPFYACNETSCLTMKHPWDCVCKRDRQRAITNITGQTQNYCHEYICRGVLKGKILCTELLLFFFAFLPTDNLTKQIYHKLTKQPQFLCINLK